MSFRASLLFFASTVFFVAFYELVDSLLLLSPSPKSTIWIGELLDCTNVTRLHCGEGPSVACGDGTGVA